MTGLRSEPALAEALERSEGEAKGRQAGHHSNNVTLRAVSRSNVILSGSEGPSEGEGPLEVLSPNACRMGNDVQNR